MPRELKVRTPLVCVHAWGLRVSRALWSPATGARVAAAIPRSSSDAPTVSTSKRTSDSQILLTWQMTSSPMPSTQFRYSPHLPALTYTSEKIPSHTVTWALHCVAGHASNMLLLIKQPNPAAGCKHSRATGFGLMCTMSSHQGRCIIGRVLCLEAVRPCNVSKALHAFH